MYATDGIIVNYTRKPAKSDRVKAARPTHKPREMQWRGRRYANRWRKIEQVLHRIQCQRFPKDTRTVLNIYIGILGGVATVSRGITMVIYDDCWRNGSRT